MVRYELKRKVASCGKIIYKVDEFHHLRKAFVVVTITERGLRD